MTKQMAFGFHGFNFAKDLKYGEEAACYWCMQVYFANVFRDLMITSGIATSYVKHGRFSE